MTERAVPGCLRRVLFRGCRLDGPYDVGGEKREPTIDLDEAQVASSLMATRDGQPDAISKLHAPVIDIDVPCSYVPSSTPGHGHLYFDVAMTHGQYFRLLDVMAEVGLVQDGFVQASRDRGFTCVRLPWVKKETVDVTGESETP